MTRKASQRTPCSLGKLLGGVEGYLHAAFWRGGRVGPITHAETITEMKSTWQARGAQRVPCKSNGNAQLECLRNGKSYEAQILSRDSP